ncbi:hypothetical protein LBK6_00550 [Leptospira borgpetersenii serovar Hardjo]|nr:hypothetical protein LBK6_00550 [Leptospira borgpetersenii serovar Hardjo]AMX60170.1 hypothetical protein LBK9_00550 [Leptospira borgpetersenii serovar Hardjo]AMX63417.1 hypothetical protein LBK30_00560 [Leptospira borgpetersenii serovar Hardjo]AMX66657.1 hypothetical protein LBHA_00560 [Leptospira borgpetersenii serovar Hardjo]
MKQTAKKKKENYQIKICLLYKIQSSHSIERHFIVFKLVNKLFRFGFYKNRRKYNNIIYFSLYFRSSSTDMFIIGSFSILNFAKSSRWENPILFTILCGVAFYKAAPIF